MSVRIIILAAGQGTRMRSVLPKVLHPLAGKPLLGHVIDAASELDTVGIHVVYGYGGEQVLQAMSDRNVTWTEQKECLGTGHAVAQVAEYLGAGETALILYGDVPLLKTETLSGLIAAAGENNLALLTVNLADPTGYGRIVRDANGKVLRIVEQKDASDNEQKITEGNTGVLAVDASQLAKWLTEIDNNNAQGEYYLTDVVGLAERDGITIATVQPDSELEVSGINDRMQLATLEREYQRLRAQELMAGGVTLVDPARFDLRGTLQAGQDVSIDINAVIEGDVVLGDHVSIGPNVCIKDARIESGVEVFANCVIENAVIGSGSRIGPFARLRPEAELAENTHVGNFVEIKKSIIGEGSKVNHLSYIGDTTIGKGVNIGAGTITCNYDGANKHRTIIEDNVFVGSDTQLVAPVTVGKNATIGAGATITKDVAAGELALSRTPQQNRAGWKRPTRKK